MTGPCPTRPSQTLVATLARRAAAPSPGRAPRRRSRRPGRARRARGSGRGRTRPAARNSVAHAPVELDRLALDPVARRRSGSARRRARGRAAPSGGGAGRRWPSGRPARARGGQVAAGALVGQRGVDVAIGDHDLAPLERGQHDGVDVLGLVGGVQQRLGAVGQARPWPGRARCVVPRAPTGVSPGSRVSTTTWPSSARAAAGGSAPASTCRPPRRPRSRGTAPSRSRSRRSRSRAEPRRRPRRRDRAASAATRCCVGRDLYAVRWVVDGGPTRPAGGASQTSSAGAHTSSTRCLSASGNRAPTPPLPRPLRSPGPGARVGTWSSGLRTGITHQHHDSQPGPDRSIATAERCTTSAPWL